MRVVFPESDEQIIKAACQLKTSGWDVLTPEDFSSNLDEYIAMAQRMVFARNWPMELLEKYLEDPLHISMMALFAGDVDLLTAGSTLQQEDILRAALRIVGLKKNYRWIFSSHFLESPDGKHRFTFADCSVIPEPKPEQLVLIAGDSAMLHEKLTGDIPGVAFLSFSTRGSREHYRIEIVRKALTRFRNKYPGIQAEGEVQFDAAFEPGETVDKSDGSFHQGNANVFIFPNMDAGNIGMKIAWKLAGYKVMGPIIHGLNRDILLLQKGSTTEEIIQANWLMKKMRGNYADIQL